MKVWFKYLIGVILGVVFALVAGSSNTVFVQVTSFLSDWALQIGRYAAYPVLFFGFALGVFNLIESKKLVRLLLFCLLFPIIAAVLFSALGIVSFFIANPSRIPISVENAVALPAFKLTNYLSAIFPSNAFQSFTETFFMLPICVFAFFAGVGAATIEKQFSKSALTVFDSFARVAYSVVVLFVDFYAILVVALTAMWTVNFSAMVQSVQAGFFTDMIILLVVDLIVIFFGVFPLVIKLTCKEVNPYRVLFAALATFIVAFFSGDANTGFVTNLRHCHESLGIRRRVSNVATPLLTIFAKPGSAMVLSISFLIIFKSYSSNSMDVQSLLLLMFLSACFSLFLAPFSVGGTYIALAGICLFFGSVYEQGYLILKPAAFFIGSVATAIDAFAAMVGSYILAYREDMILEKDIRFFI
jgi:putative transporter